MLALQSMASLIGFYAEVAPAVHHDMAVLMTFYAALQQDVRTPNPVMLVPKLCLLSTSCTFLFAVRCS